MATPDLGTLGTFLLVLVAAGAPMMGDAFPDSVGRAAAVTAPGLMVMAVILFMGKVSGAHLNPAVTFAFGCVAIFLGSRPRLRVAQLVGAVLAACCCSRCSTSQRRTARRIPRAVLGRVAFLLEVVLTLGFVSVILGTASGAQNIGMLGALAVGGYIVLAGLWGSPLSGASMNPARTFGPHLVGADFSSYWVYVSGPLLGATLAVGAAWILRGPGGGRAGSGAAQGAIQTEVEHPEKA